MVLSPSFEYHNDPKFSDVQVLANSAEPDQTTPLVMEQSDLGQHCSPFLLDIWNAFLLGKTALFKFWNNYSNFPDVQNFRIFTVRSKSIFKSFLYHDMKTDILTIIGCVSDWWSGGCRFDAWVRHHSFVEIDHGIFSVVILSLH